MVWQVVFHEEFEQEFDALPTEAADEIFAHAKLLASFGPQLGRPRVDTLSGSRHTNMKELRFFAANGVWRVAFAFDPKRNAVLLVAGDKAGVSQKQFYRQLIAKVDTPFRFLSGREEKEGQEVMSKTLDQKLEKLSAARRKKIEARASELIAEELSLRELRRAHRLTQKHMAQKLGIGQEGVSRLEQRSDLLLSTLGSYIKAMGGTLSIVAKFPDRQPVILSGLSALESGLPPRNTRRD